LTEGQQSRFLSSAHGFRRYSHAAAPDRLRRGVQKPSFRSGKRIAFSPAVRALIADDDATTTTIVAHALSGWGLDVEVAHDGAAAWQRLNAVDPPAIAVIDWTMPRIDGPELCRRARGTSRLSTMYILLLTARNCRADLIAGLDAGADDYMTKPVDLDELRARVHVGLRVASLQQSLARRVADLRRAHDQLQEMASTDALTQLYSRRWWFDMAGTEFARSRRYGGDLGVLLVDLDHFKRVNDRFGHEAGDRVLRAFADLLRGECRQSDIIGRVGGEEFALALPETSLAQAQTVATRLTDGCRRLALPEGDDFIQWSCSIGITDGRADDPDIGAMLRRADAALYEAKRAGRDRWANAA
jgi:diguanylate cyclase (GGDEF)-like protein